MTNHIIKIKIMKTNLETKGFSKFLFQNLNAAIWANLHQKLNISRRMLTMLLRNPKRFTADQITTLAELSGVPTNEIISNINQTEN